MANNKDLIAYNLFEDHLAVPMKNYPKKSDGSLYVDFPTGLDLYCHEDKPCWKSYHHVAKMRASKFEAYITA